MYDKEHVVLIQCAFSYTIVSMILIEYVHVLINPFIVRFICLLINEFQTVHKSYPGRKLIQNNAMSLILFEQLSIYQNNDLSIIFC